MTNFGILRCFTAPVALIVLDASSLPAPSSGRSGRAMKSALSFFALCLAPGCAPSASRVDVSDAWARATAPGQSSAAVYATIANGGSADQLVEVSSKGAMAMLHRSDNENGVARMRMLSQVAIPAGERVTLAPAATHIMLTGLSAPLAAGASFPLTMRFAQAGPRTVSVTVVAPGAR